MDSSIYLSLGTEGIKEIVGIVFSGMSLTVIILLFISYFINPPSTENVFFRMVIHMEFPNALYAISGFIAHPESLSYEFCALSAALRQFSLLSTSLWTLAIAYHIKNSISDHEIKPFSGWYLIFGYGLSLPFAIIPLFYSIYQSTPIYCGIPFDEFTQNLIIYYIPILTVLLGTCYCYFSVIRYLWISVSKEAAQEFYPLLIYPFLVVLYNVGSFIYLILEISGNESNLGSEILIIITTGILQAQGMFDVLVYSRNYAIREEIKLKFCPHRVSEVRNGFDPNFKSRMETIIRRNSTLIRDHPMTADLVGSDLSPKRNQSAQTI